MVGSPREYLSRLIFPVQRETYCFGSEDIPERFQGSGSLETDFARLGSEKATEFHIDLFESTEEGWRDIERSMYANRQEGFDVADEFEIEERRIGIPGRTRLDFLGPETLNELDYITTDQEITGEDVEARSLEDIRVDEVPEELEFRSMISYGKAWGPEKKGSPMVEGKVSTEELEEGYVVIYEIDGASFYDNSDVESQAEIVLDMMGLDYDNLFSDYTNESPDEIAEVGNYPEV